MRERFNKLSWREEFEGSSMSCHERRTDPFLS